MGCHGDEYHPRKHPLLRLPCPLQESFRLSHLLGDRKKKKKKEKKNKCYFHMKMSTTLSRFVISLLKIEDGSLMDRKSAELVC